MSAAADGGAVAAATPAAGAVAAASDPSRDAVADGGAPAVVVNMPPSPTQCLTMNPLQSLAAHRLVHHKTYRQEYIDHEFLHYACHPPNALGLKGCAQAVQDVAEAMALLGVKDWGLRIDARGAIVALIDKKMFAASQALQGLAEELSGKVWDAVPSVDVEDSDDEGDAMPVKGVLWRTSHAPGTYVMLDRQKVERFICRVDNDKAMCLLDLPRDEQHALWRHLAQFLRKYQVGLERIDVSHGSWMESKFLHVKLTAADKAGYVQLHDKVSKTPFANKNISKRR